MKIAINACYGGFGISTEALKRAIAEGAKGVEIHEESECYGGKPRPSYETRTDAGDGYESNSCATLFKDGKAFSFDRGDESRSCPVLIKIIEEMGVEANGICANLKVIEIPDGIEYEISEYDGFERVEEKHRSWS